MGCTHRVALRQRLGRQVTKVLIEVVQAKPGVSCSDGAHRSGLMFSVRLDFRELARTKNLFVRAFQSLNRGHLANLNALSSVVCSCARRFGLAVPWCAKLCYDSVIVLCGRIGTVLICFSASLK